MVVREPVASYGGRAVRGCICQRRPDAVRLLAFEPLRRTAAGRLPGSFGVWSRMVATRCVSQKASYQQGCVIPAHAGIQLIHTTQ